MPRGRIPVTGSPSHADGPSRASFRRGTRIFRADLETNAPRRTLRIGLVLGLVAAGMFFAVWSSPDPARRASPAPVRARPAGQGPPNVVILLADDLGYGDVGFQGCPDIPTPHIDRLAREGIRMTSGYASSPLCSPSRAGLLTGRYQNRFGHEANPAPDDGLATEEVTIADRFREAGYVTGLVGKWHLGHAPEFHPRRRGFDEFFGFLGGEFTYFPRPGHPLYHGTEKVAVDEYLTDAFAREGVDFIERHKDRPFFLLLSFNAVHTPLQATDERLRKFAGIGDETRRVYAAMAAALDEAVGRVMDKLRAEGLDEDTLVVFLSDNGGPTHPGSTVNGSRNTPLRGSKGMTLEGGIRVPFCARWKGHLPAGVAYDQPAIHLDLLPTALAAAGITARPEWGLDGVNLLPYWTGAATGPPHERIYWRLYEQMAVRQGDWKIVSYDPAADPTGPTGEKATPRRLYNLAEDIGETNDLGARLPEKVRELEAHFQRWQSSLR